MMTRYLVVLITLLFLYGCNSDSKISQNPNINEVSGLSEISQIKLSAEALKYVNNIWINVHVNHTEDHIAILDRSTNTIVLVNMEGEYVSHFGGKGSGPEELKTAYLMGWDDMNQFIVNDYSNAMFKKFAMPGDFMSTYEDILKENLWARSRRLVNSNGKWYLGIEVPGARYGDDIPQFAVLDNEFKLINLHGELDIYRLDNRQIDILTTHIETVESNLYVTSSDVPYIHIYDRNNNYELTSRVGTQSENFQLSPVIVSPAEMLREDFKKHVIDNHSIVMDLYILKQDSILAMHFLNHTQEFYESRNQFDSRHFLALYDRHDDYRFLGEIELDYLPVGRTPSGKLLLLESDDPDNIVFHLVRVDIPNNEIEN